MNHVYEIGDLVQPNSATYRRKDPSLHSADAIGIVVKVHRSYENPNAKIFYWIKWNGDRRSYVHFDHELTLIQRGEEK